VRTDTEETTWTALMEQSLDGDCDAYARLLTALTARLRRAVRARARSVGLEPEDVVQEVLMALHSKRNTWVRGTPVAPWVSAIARNKIVDAHRRRGRHPEVDLESVAGTLQQPDDDGVVVSSDLELGLAALSPNQRKVVEAISLEGYSAQEAASMLSMSAVGVRVTLHRAIKTLAAFLTRGP
jgi:RNA polymerase sigma-70 factor (ECF subfamily)